MSAHVNPSDAELYKILKEARVIAIVGASSNPERPSHGVMRALQSAGYKVIPFNPGQDEILGEKAYASLSDVPEKIDIVDVFRRPEHTPPIAQEAVKIGAKVLWLQLDIINDEAAAIARAGGLTVVMDLCNAVVRRTLAVPIIQKS